MKHDHNLRNYKSQRDWNLCWFSTQGRRTRGRGKKKKPKIGRPWKKSGGKPRGRFDVKRHEDKERKVDRVKQALDILVNPFDHMNIDQKKELSLFLVFRRLEVWNDKINCKNKSINFCNVQIAIASGESYFPSRTRIVADVADEVILHISHLWNYVFVALTLLNKVGVASSSL